MPYIKQILARADTEEAGEVGPGLGDQAKTVYGEAADGAEKYIKDSGAESYIRQANGDWKWGVIIGSIVGVVFAVLLVLWLVRHFVTSRRIKQCGECKEMEVRQRGTTGCGFGRGTWSCTNCSAKQGQDKELD